MYSLSLFIQLIVYSQYHYAQPKIVKRTTWVRVQYNEGQRTTFKKPLNSFSMIPRLIAKPHEQMISKSKTKVTIRGGGETCSLARGKIRKWQERERSNWEICYRRSWYLLRIQQNLVISLCIWCYNFPIHCKVLVKIRFSHIRMTMG